MRCERVGRRRRGKEKEGRLRAGSGHEREEVQVKGHSRRSSVARLTNKRKGIFGGRFSASTYAAIMREIIEVQGGRLQWMAVIHRRAAVGLAPRRRCQPADGVKNAFLAYMRLIMQNVCQRRTPLRPENTRSAARARRDGAGNLKSVDAQSKHCQRK